MHIVWHCAAAIPDVIIEFDQLAVNASEGNSAVVCASAQFTNEVPFDTVFFTNLSVKAGTAGTKN